MHLSLSKSIPPVFQSVEYDIMHSTGCGLFDPQGVSEINTWKSSDDGNINIHTFMITTPTTSMFKAKLRSNKIYYNNEPDRYYYNALYFSNCSKNQNTDLKIIGRDSVTDKHTYSAFQQLQASVNGRLLLHMDSSGNVTYSRIKDNASGKLVPLSSNAKDLMEAIDDHSIFVTVIASDNYVSTRNTIIPGGAFMGNRVTNRSVYSRSAYVRIVETQQEIVDSTLRKIDSIFNRPGSCMIHEVLESYEGGKISQEAGESSPRSDGPGTVYDEAHRRSTTQHGHFEQECYDKLGKKQEEFNRDTTWKVLFYVKNKGKRILVQTSYNK